MSTRRNRLGPGGSNLSLGVQRSRGCGYECRALRVRQILGVEPPWPIAFLALLISLHPLVTRVLQVMVACVISKIRNVLRNSNQSLSQKVTEEVT